MKLIIDIPNEAYDWLVNGFPDEEDAVRLLDIVKNGTPLSESEDCVSLEAVINVFDTWWMNNHETDNAIEILEDKLNALPPVIPAERVGRWEYRQYDIAFPEIGNYHCSSCDAVGKNGDNYCSVCGAKMGGEQNEVSD